VPTDKRSALGINPLNQGIFNRTTQATSEPVAAPAEAPEATTSEPSDEASKRSSIQQTTNKIQENSFLNLEDTDREAITLRLPVVLNDWLDDLLKHGKRNYGRKIPKEIWLQAALELLKAAPIDWKSIDSEDALRTTLHSLANSFNSQDC
jgi:hypothetical protein